MIGSPPSEGGNTLDDSTIKDVLAGALARGGSFAELYAETRIAASVRLDDGRAEEVVSGRDRGAGVRVNRGRATAYAYTNRLDRDSLLAAAEVAADALRGDERRTVRDLRREPEHIVAPVIIRPADVPTSRKVEALLRMDAAARGAGAEVRQVTGGYAEVEQDVLIANSEGLLAEDRRVRTRVTCQVVAARDGVIMTGSHHPGASAGFELLDRETPESIGERAARKALVMLNAKPAPSGEMPVVLAAGGGGVLFHEACGHPLEADTIEKQASVYVGRMGKRVGSKLVNGVDDASVPGAWGSFGYDDEGTPSRRTVLFEDGVLVSYLSDRLRAELLGIEPTGNGRRESYAHPPVPRMTNSFLLPGKDSRADIFGSVKHGLYAKSFGGGQVNPASGEFVFGLNEAYLIENGEVAAPVRGANLIGFGPDVLARIEAVGDDLDMWTGTCGKDGQAVPANVGMPTTLVGRITVGGTA